MDQRTRRRRHSRAGEAARDPATSTEGGRAYSILAYGVILATCIAGLVQASLWSICAGASLLALLSIADPQGSHAYHARIGSHATPAALYASSVLNAAMAASLAFMLGRSIAWYWGL
jgi:hypothetical protein